MQDFIPIETIHNKLDTIPIIAGQLIICKDTNEQFYDSSDNIRIEVSSIIYLNTKSEYDSLTNPINNKLYVIKENGAVYLYTNDTWSTIIAANQTKTMVFYLGKRITSKEYPMILEVPENCMIKDISGFCNIPGSTSDTILHITKAASSSDLSDPANWTSIFDPSYLIKFSPNSMKSNSDYLLSTTALTKGDLLKVHVLLADDNIEAITLNINLTI